MILGLLGVDLRGNVDRLRLLWIGWDEAMVRHLPAIKSDHNPIFLYLDPSLSSNRHCRSFRFEAMWLSHPQFMKTKKEKDTLEAHTDLRNVLRSWNKEVFGNLHYKKISS
ncbi:hypothetical protein V2J09_021029 [Rumex salicifolius]